MRLYHEPILVYGGMLAGCAVCCAVQAFEESQGKLEEELALRTAREIAIREEAEAKRAAEEAEKR